MCILTRSAQELEARDKAAAEQLAAAVGRERGAAEERGKASVLMQAEKEKGALQEQLTFLKMQLQYALTVGMGKWYIRQAASVERRFKKPVCSSWQLF